MSTNLVTVNAMFAHAKALAAVTSDALNTATETTAIAKETVSAAPIALMMAMSETYTPEQIDSFPVIDSTEGNNPDIVMVASEKKGGKEKPVSFYVIWADNTPIGAKTCASIAVLKYMEQNNEPGDRPSVLTANEFAELAALNPHQVSVLLAKLSRKRGTIRASYKTSIRLMHQIRQVNELSECNATLVPDGNNGYENTILVMTTDPARIVNGMPQDFIHYNVGQFLRLNPAKAEEQGGSFAALKATLKREKKEGEVSTSDATPQLIRSLDTFDARLTDMHEFMVHTWDSKNNSDYASFLTHLNKSEDALLSFFDIYSMMGDVAGIDGLAEKALAIRNARDAADQKQAA